MARILVVDDDRHILTTIGAALQFIGCDVTLKSNPLEAQEELQNSDDIGLLITDIIMPELNGLQMLKNIKDKFPNLKVITMTGADFDFSDCSEYLGSFKMLKKPFHLRFLYGLKCNQFFP